MCLLSVCVQNLGRKDSKGTAVKKKGIKMDLNARDVRIIPEPKPKPVDTEKNSKAS